MSLKLRAFPIRWQGQRALLVQLVVFSGLLIGLHGTQIVYAGQTNRLGLAAVRHIASLAIDYSTPEAHCRSIANGFPSISGGSLRSIGVDPYLEGVSDLFVADWKVAEQHLEKNSDILSVYQRGWALWCEGSSVEALKAWMAYGSTIALSFRDIGEHLFYAGDPQSALSWLTMSWNLVSDSAATQTLLGKAYANLGNPGRAAEMYNRAIEVGGANAEAYTGAAIAEYKLGQRGAAKAHIQEAIHLEPGSWLNWQILGGILLDEKAWPAAEVAFRTVITLNPSYDGAYASLGTALAQQRRFDEAQVALLAAVQHTHDRVLGTRYLIASAKAGSQAGKIKEGIRSLEEALTDDRANIDVLEALAELYALNGDCEKLVGAYENLKVLALEQGREVPHLKTPCAVR